MDSGFGYIAVSRQAAYEGYMDEEGIHHEPWFKMLDDAIEQVKAWDCPGLIVDIRNNTGGDDELGQYFTQKFYGGEGPIMADDYPIGSSGNGFSRKPDGTPVYELQKYTPAHLNGEQGQAYGLPVFMESDCIVRDPAALLGEEAAASVHSTVGPFFLDGTGAWTKPVVGIINQHCVSTGEGLARALRYAPNARTVGFQGTSASFGMAGGEVHVGDLEKGIRFMMNYPFGASVDWDGNVQLDSNPQVRVAYSLHTLFHGQCQT